MMQVVSEASNAWHRKVAAWIKDEESKLPKKHLIAQNISNFRYPITDPDPNISIFNFHYTYPAAAHENYHLNKVIGFNETGLPESWTLHTGDKPAVLMVVRLFNHLDIVFSGQRMAMTQRWHRRGSLS